MVVQTIESNVLLISSEVLAFCEYDILRDIAIGFNYHDIKLLMFDNVGKYY
jgi:hypothetical protein